MGLKKYIKLFEEFNEPQHPGFFTSREETEAWLKKMGVKDYTINDDLTVDVDSVVNLQKRELAHLPVQFGSVGGNFWCENNQLTSLVGAPSSVEGGFHCANNQLTTLKGAPSSVKGDFRCDDNQLTTLKGAPSSVKGDFWCENNRLTSLIGAPSSVKGNFDCDSNRLTSLVGAPSSVGGRFWCHSNQLTTLEGAPESVEEDFYCQDNQLTSLEHAPSSVKGSFYCSYNRLTDLKGAPSSVGKSFYCQNNPILIPHLPAKVDGIVESDVKLYSNRAEALKAMDVDSFFDAHREVGTNWSELRSDIESEPDLLKRLADHFGSEEVLWRIWSSYKMASHEDDDKLKDIGIWD